MVRKRSRKYESSDDNDSDSDTEFSGGNSNKTSQPAAKRYSLRERRAPPPEFDFFGLADEDDDNDGDGDDKDAVDEQITKLSSDDEDFEVDSMKSKRKQKKNSKTNDDDNDDSGDDNQESDNEVETLPYKNCETLESSTQNGLIDFEDIIRADIVVRKKIDYDHIIEKSTICLSADRQAPCGPKSKNFYEDSNDEQLNIFEPHIETHTQMDDDGSSLLNLESIPENGLPNFINNEDNSNKILVNGTNLEQNLATIVNDSGGGGDNDNSCSNRNNRVEEDDDDDVIVLGELKQDIIVLDD